MAAQQFTYVPSFDATPPARPSSPPEEPAEYYRYDAGNAGRLTSALPTYQPGYAPFPVYPANVAYFPVSYTTPNVPVHWLSTFYVALLTHLPKVRSADLCLQADNPATAPVFLTYPQPSASRFVGLSAPRVATVQLTLTAAAPANPRRPLYPPALPGKALPRLRLTCSTERRMLPMHEPSSSSHMSLPSISSSIAASWMEATLSVLPKTSKTILIPATGKQARKGFHTGYAFLRRTNKAHNRACRDRPFYSLVQHLWQALAPDKWTTGADDQHNDTSFKGPVRFVLDNG